MFGMLRAIRKTESLIWEQGSRAVKSIQRIFQRADRPESLKFRHVLILLKDANSGGNRLSDACPTVGRQADQLAHQGLQKHVLRDQLASDHFTIIVRYRHRVLPFSHGSRRALRVQSGAYPFACLKADYALFGDRNRFAGTGISTLTGTPDPRPENPKISELHPSTAGERRGDLLVYDVDNLAQFRSGSVRVLRGQVIDQFRANH
jgi:hypothetical protein